MNEPHSLAAAVSALRAGQVIAYPTEAVYGLGCDPANPDAVMALLDLKGRAREQGLILIAGHIEQLRPWANFSALADLQPLKDSWPGPVTWIVPASEQVSAWVSGGRDTVAVRVTDHAASAALCEAFGGALVSTSANPSGSEPARSAAQVEAYFGTRIGALVPGALGGRLNPSEIRDARSGDVLRAG